MTPVTGTPLGEKPSKTPRVSVNQLAEYLEAIATRRKQIVKDAKNPPKVKVTRYRIARDTIKGYLENDREEEYVLKVIEELEAVETFDSEFQEQDNQLSIASLEALLDADVSELDDLEITVNSGENHLLNIAGVNISVNPDLLISLIDDDVTLIGAIKLHIGKSPLSDEAQKIVGVILHLYVSKYLITKGQVADNDLCFSFDVFKGSLESCPSSHKHRLKKIEAACEEIALRWGSL